MVKSVEKWDVFELRLKGPEVGNPFKDVDFRVEFRFEHRTVVVCGFYDGDGEYVARFMPDSIGRWSYVTSSGADSLHKISGEFECVQPDSSNHGPVRVFRRFHFSYADGTRYIPVGTTCYAWAHQGDDLEQQTLDTLRSAPFNKMRMTVFPKHYDFNHNEPVHHPFERDGDGAGDEDGSWNYDRPNVEFYRHFEGRIRELGQLGIEADIILFHPYDRWGYAEMNLATDDFYLRYLIARLSAFRNVWWSMANEWDLMTKDELHWEHLFKVVQEADPYGHLCSIHNCTRMYDHTKPHITHVCVQNHDTTLIKGWRQRYGKPVIDDECCYEGNINHGWGNISAEKLTQCFWEGVVAGGYVGHGETYVHPEDILWWSKGGVLYGESAPRLGFLRELLENAPLHGLDPVELGWDMPTAGKAGEYLLLYFGHRRPSYKDFSLPEGCYSVDIIDTWNMTVESAGTFGNVFRLPLPGTSYIAVRVCRVGELGCAD